MANTDQQTPNTQRNLLSDYSLSKTAHPCLIFTDLLFKGVPVAMYFISGLFTNSLVIQISTITLISAIDFWFTKNILGRELVGLRWQRVISESGEEEYVYECKGDETAAHPLDKKFFWGLLGLVTIVWGVLLFFNITSVTNLMVIAVPFVLSGFNLWAFYQCSKETQARVQTYIDKQSSNIKRQAINTAVNNYDNV